MFVNPATFVALPGLKSVEINPLSPEDARKLVADADNDRLGSLFELTVALGLRLGEATRLTWTDVDIPTETLSVRNQLQRIGDKLQLVELKTDRSQRRVVPPQIRRLTQCGAHGTTRQQRHGFLERKDDSETLRHDDNENFQKRVARNRSVDIGRRMVL